MKQDWCFTCGHFIDESDPEHAEHRLRSQRERERVQAREARQSPPDLGIHVADTVQTQDKLA